MTRRASAAWRVAAALAALGAASLASQPCRAEQPPALRPTRDVDVTYTMVPAGQAEGLRQRMRYAAADGKLRVDPPTPGIYMLVDYKTRRMEMVRSADRKLLVLDNGANKLPGEAPAGDYVRRNEDKVAGVPCTEWDTKDSGNQPVTLCISPDGVLLRARSGPHVMAEAVQVSFSPQDGAVFEPPPGYAPVLVDQGAQPPPPQAP